MERTVLGREVITGEELPRIADALARELRPFSPERVIYIEQGGRAIGLLVADALGVPSEGIDLSYPLSRLIGRLPGAVRLLAWPVKEISYRLASPQLNRPLPALRSGMRVALVDDSASTGRSIGAALRAIAGAGVERASVRVAVVRAGPRARGIVDYYATGRPALFVAA